MEFEIILVAIPIFLLMIAAEYWVGLKRGRNTYKLNDAINSLSLGTLSQAVSVCTLFFQVGIYEIISLEFGISQLTNFWSSWAGWITAILLYDFLAYWAHRVSHESALFWAAHSVHHQSQYFNFTTALRQESFYPITTFIFYIPLALLGLPSTQYVLIGILILIYQFWVHTEHIGKLRWFDKVFVSPSNHRVHHAINDDYIDKNYGDFLILWDRIFGTYKEEAGPCVYGTKTPLNSWNPIWANFSVLSGLFSKAVKQVSVLDKFLVFFKSPGWCEAGDAHVAYALIYDPAISKRNQIGAVGLFLLSLAVLVVYLYFSKSLNSTEKVAGGLSIAWLLWWVGRLLEKRT